MLCLTIKFVRIDDEEEDLEGGEVGAAVEEERLKEMDLDATFEGASSIGAEERSGQPSRRLVTARIVLS